MDNQTLSSQLIFDQVKKRISEGKHAIKAVCFDFFDTLVSRSVPPEDTKKISANQLVDLLQVEIDGELIYQIRSNLEKRLCQENRQKNNDPEFDLVSLGNSLYQILKSMMPTGSLKSKDFFTKQFIQIELAVEKQVQTPKNDIVEILKYCNRNGILTVIISDFYIPRAYFKKFLVFHGLLDFIDDIYVSADFHLTKGNNGRLYDIVCKKTGFDPAQMVMIGDNIHADGVMAIQKGFTAYCLELTEKQSPAILQGEYSAEKQFDHILSSHKASYFPEMGLTLHYFIHNLFQQTLRDQHKDLFFCSKEGEFLRKLFVRYQEIRFGYQVIKTHYLLVSRKATYICSLNDLENEDFARLFVHYRDLSLAEFLQSLNFSEVQANTLCEQLQLEPTKRHQNLKEHADFKTLISSDLFTTSYDLHRQCQQENFRSYLNSFEVDFIKDGLALVDVGWKGSIQNNIFYALGGKIAIAGYFIGLLSPTEVKKKNSKTGLLFYDFPTHSPFIHAFNNNRSLFEMVLGASHGSADGYFSQKQFRDVRTTRKSTFLQTDDFPLVTVLDLPKERKLFNELISPIQQDYFSLHEKLTKEFLSVKPKIPSHEWFAKKHARMVFRPRKKEVEFYAELFHLENFGVFEFTAFSSDTKITLLQKTKNLVALLKDPAAYLETGVWPPVILRRLGLEAFIGIEGKKRYNIVFGKYK